MSKEHFDIVIALIIAMAGFLTAFAAVLKYFVFPRKPKTEEVKDTAEADKLEAESRKARAEVNGINTSSLIAIVNALQDRVEHADLEAERLRKLVSTLRDDVIVLQQRAVDIEIARAKERLVMEKTIAELQAEIVRLKARLKILEPEIGSQSA